MNKQKILVCVTKQASCERLIKKGYELLKETGELHVIHITRKLLRQCDGESIDHLFSISKKYSATMNIVVSENTIEEINKFILKNKINTVVLGESLARKNSAKDMATKIIKGIDKNIEFELVPCEYNIWDKDVV
ncbi:hypothetical protein [Alkaliphilus sp. B6464]|uniref:hypothetical protein n=1 Tax=Alkaliphilus sp. B6464 TaxID=2731219 RepID=UPI001BAC5C08|nr:hypothetical protein [Alkaliphilus sp. B6464]QUH21761.1 hypothetical protein HYG84_17650 [Alkaliphilus sp. B6464]